MRTGRAPRADRSRRLPAPTAADPAPLGAERLAGHFRAIHVLLCIAYGVAIAAVHAAMRTPTVIFAMLFCTILVQAAFVMLTSFLGALGPGTSVWTRFLVGNLIAAALTAVYLWRTHPLKALYHLAEAEV